MALKSYNTFVLKYLMLETQFYNMTSFKLYKISPYLSACLSLLITWHYALPKVKSMIF